MMPQCTAKSKQSGERCKRHASPGFTVCAIHGGKTPVGIAAPSFKHGRYSKHLPARLSERYEQAIHDPDLLVLRDEIAVVDTRIAELLGKVDTEGGSGFVTKARTILDQFIEAQVRSDIDGMKLYLTKLDAHIRAGSAEWAMWGEVTDLFDTRRKLVESERKRLVDAQLMIDARQAMTLLAAITAIIRENVKDPDALRAISSGLLRLTGEAGE